MRGIRAMAAMPNSREVDQEVPMHRQYVPVVKAWDVFYLGPMFRDVATGYMTLAAAFKD